jgi:hypothetical protein
MLPTRSSGYRDGPSSPERWRPKEIAFVAYPGLTPLDLVGPLQVVTVLTLFSSAYRPVVVGETLDPIHTDGPMKFGRGYDL